MSGLDQRLERIRHLQARRDSFEARHPERAAGPLTPEQAARIADILAEIDPSLEVLSQVIDHAKAVQHGQD